MCYSKSTFNINVGGKKLYEIEYCTSVGFILQNGVVEKKKKKKSREDFLLHLSLALISFPLWHPSFPHCLLSLPAHVPFCHFALNSSCLSFSQCILSPGAEQSCFSAGVQGARPRRVLVSQVFIKLSAMSTRTNRSSLLPPSSQIPASPCTLFHLMAGSASLRSPHLCAHVCVRASVRVCVSAWTGSPEALLLPPE